MARYLDFEASSKNAESRKFVVNLKLLSGKEPEVRSCEVTQKQFRNRTSFTSASTLRDVFTEELADSLHECLNKLSLNSTEVLSLPDLVLEAPGLLLAGAQVMSTKKQDGSFNIIFRFRFFLGGINNAFAKNTKFDDFVSEQNLQTATQVFSEIAMPLLDLCRAADAGIINAGEHLGEFGRVLTERSCEIQFQIELVKRYVENIDRSRSYQGKKVLERTQQKISYRPALEKESFEESRMYSHG